VLYLSKPTWTVRFRPKAARALPVDGRGWLTAKKHYQSLSPALVQNPLPAKRQPPARQLQARR